jgi:hypothetical protein
MEDYTEMYNDMLARTKSGGGEENVKAMRGSLLSSCFKDEG